MIVQITVHVSKHYSHTLSFTQKKRITYITVPKPYPLKVHPVEDHTIHSTKILPSQIPLSTGPHTSQYQNLTLSHSAQERTTQFTVPKSYPLKFHSVQDHTIHSTKILPFHIPLKRGPHNSQYQNLTLSNSTQYRTTQFEVPKSYPFKFHSAEDHKICGYQPCPLKFHSVQDHRSSQYQNLTLSHSAQERTTQFTVPKSYPLKFHSLQDHTIHSTKILPFHIPLRIGRHNSPYTALPSQTLRCIPGHNIW